MCTLYIWKRNMLVLIIGDMSLYWRIASYQVQARVQCRSFNETFLSNRRKAFCFTHCQTVGFILQKVIFVLGNRLLDKLQKKNKAKGLASDGEIND